MTTNDKAKEVSMDDPVGTKYEDGSFRGENKHRWRTCSPDIYGDDDYQCQDCGIYCSKYPPGCTPICKGYIPFYEI